MSLFNLMQSYPTEREVIVYLERIRWGDPPCCSRCGATDKLTKQKKPSRYWCGYYRKYFNAWLAKEFVNGMAHTNGIESVWAVLKHGFNGVYHNWSKKHCHQYISEFTFRLNEGNCERDTQDRFDDLFRAMVSKTITFEELTA